MNEEVHAAESSGKGYKCIYRHTICQTTISKVKNELYVTAVPLYNLVCWNSQVWWTTWVLFYNLFWLYYFLAEWAIWSSYGFFLVCLLQKDFETRLPQRDWHKHLSLPLADFQLNQRAKQTAILQRGWIQKTVRSTQMKSVKRMRNIQIRISGGEITCVLWLFILCHQTSHYGWMLF